MPLGEIRAPIFHGLSPGFVSVVGPAGWAQLLGLILGRTCLPPVFGDWCAIGAHQPAGDYVWYLGDYSDAGADAPYSSGCFGSHAAERFLRGPYPMVDGPFNCGMDVFSLLVFSFYFLY